MIKFFRRIRQRLLSENKFSKYLLYAVGEIVLVVIGILIALAINNWNVQRERNLKQIAILKQIDEDFSNDLNDLRDNYNTHNRGILAGQAILDAIENNLPYTDSLGEHFGELGMTRFISTTGAYESLKSIGFDIITNDTLRSKIIRLHDESYEAFDAFDSGMFLKYSFILESWVKYYDEVTWRAKPLDFEALKESEEYKTILKTHMYQLKILQTRLYDVVIQEILSVQEEIRDEIDRLQQ